MLLNKLSNINTVLEHKIQTYMSPAKEKSYRDKNINATAPDLEHVDKKKLARDKEKRKNFSTQANTFFNNKTLESMGNMADYSSLKKYKESLLLIKWIRSKNNNLREKMSPLLSQKEPSFSDETDIKDIRDKLRMSQMEDFGDDIEEEYLVKNRKTSQYSIPHSDFETSSEPFEDFRLGANGNKYETAKKIQQIKVNFFSQDLLNNG